MIPSQTFHCPRCGAPGEVSVGMAEYSCTCRFSVSSYQPSALSKRVQSDAARYHWLREHDLTDVYGDYWSERLNARSLGDRLDAVVDALIVEPQPQNGSEGAK